MESDKISIIMPSWNTGKYIKESIDSVIKQTYKNWELIIVDDASNDDTLEIIQSINNDKIKFIRNERNVGAALTRNRAIREATGEWIAFLDSDDIWLPEKLEKQLKFMKENNYNFSYHMYEKIDENSNKLNKIVTGPKVVTKRKMYDYGYPGCLTFMYNANFFGLIQIKDIKKNNDYAILLILCKKSPCYLLEENLAQYRIRKKSISHDKLIKKIKSHYDLFNYCDGKNSIISILLVMNNIFHGFLKKIFYEKSI